MKHNKAILLTIIFTITIIQMICCWHIDIAASTLINNNGTSTLTNGFGTFNPLIIYHAALYGSIICFIILVLICIFILHKEKKP